MDLHHIQTRKSGGSDALWNLMPLVHPLHQQVHGMGLRLFAQRHPSVKQWLLANGWEFDEIALKWRHYEKEEEI